MGIKTVLTIGAFLSSNGIVGAINIDENSCPKNWGANTLGNDDTIYCCYGSTVINGDEGYCCIADRSGSQDLPSVGGEPGDDCFPFCGATTTTKAVLGRAIPTPSCIETVPFFASDYSERVSAASKSIEDSHTSTTRPLATTSATSDGSDGDDDGDDGETAAQPSPTNAAGIMVAGSAAHIGGVAAAVALLIL